MSGIDVAHLERQRAWSRATFGPGERTVGVIDHIRKELNEILEHPEDITEWADLLILAFDGAWRVGFEPADIISAVKEKQAVNELREWPDWRTAEPGKAIEHIRFNSLTEPATYNNASYRIYNIDGGPKATNNPPPTPPSDRG